MSRIKTLVPLIVGCSPHISTQKSQTGRKQPHSTSSNSNLFTGSEYRGHIRQLNPKTWLPTSLEGSSGPITGPVGYGVYHILQRICSYKFSDAIQLN